MLLTIFLLHSAEQCSGKQFHLDLSGIYKKEIGSGQPE
jgi:hypothetical protein